MSILLTGTFTKMVATNQSLTYMLWLTVCLIEGHGRRERRRWKSESDPGWAERARGKGRSTWQTEDQEHLCHQVHKLQLQISFNLSAVILFNGIKGPGFRYMIYGSRQFVSIGHLKLLWTSEKVKYFLSAVVRFFLSLVENTLQVAGKEIMKIGIWKQLLFPIRSTTSPPFKQYNAENMGSIGSCHMFKYSC